MGDGFPINNRHSLRNFREKRVLGLIRINNNMDVVVGGNRLMRNNFKSRVEEKMGQVPTVYSHITDDPISMVIQRLRSMDLDEALEHLHATLVPNSALHKEVREKLQKNATTKP